MLNKINTLIGLTPHRKNENHRSFIYKQSSSKDNLTELVFITSFPPRECGIATYSQDLIYALKNKFENAFKISICPIESNNEPQCNVQKYPYHLNSDERTSYLELIDKLNKNNNIGLIIIQHEFGFFSKQRGDFVELLMESKKPICIVFHTVLPHPGAELLSHVTAVANHCRSIIVMNTISKELLMKDYGINQHKIEVIPHGTHLVKHTNKKVLKKFYHLSGRTILSTFGLLSSGKSIETTLDALPEIVQYQKNVLFLIIGKTHPGIIKNEGETYRDALIHKVKMLHLEKHVYFINEFLNLNTLLDYLQLTDIYLFTSKDPHQAVSGTFSYAISCGCPIITTPIPHAKEALKNKAGISFDFANHHQLAEKVVHLLSQPNERAALSYNGLHHMNATVWENSALAHGLLFSRISCLPIHLHLKLPPINLNHLQKLTTSFGIIQFSQLNTPDFSSGYTLDDNARALITFCMYLGLTKDKQSIHFIIIYLNFIEFCLKEHGNLYNYVSHNKKYSKQNDCENLEDSLGRAIWSLGYLLDQSENLPPVLIDKAEKILTSLVPRIEKIHSTRAMAFTIKGLYHANLYFKNNEYTRYISCFADRLIRMYEHESSQDWKWFENYLTYGNSLIPESLLCASLVTGNQQYMSVAIESFDFLLSKTINGNTLQLISNKGWLYKNSASGASKNGGEQPIDAAYTVLALKRFYEVLKTNDYLNKIVIAFEWFLGNNQLNQIIYNPCTGGCYDGLETKSVNLNQGAESTISYHLARLAVEEVNRELHKSESSKKSKLSSKVSSYTSQHQKR
jgi:glycosyltransferase involved in cell wall biosynthesis